jgi:diadenosine tetraphosphatase ApaH/serine/threonine PP2A family protein phosphatase
MRIAVLSDIHGNLPALDAVFKWLDKSGITTVWCLGDIVGYGPFPNQCVEIIRNRCSLVVSGNHDSGVVGGTPVDDFNEYGLQAILWTKKELEGRHLEYLRALPLVLVHDSCTLVHASPLDPEAWHYVHTVRAGMKNFQAFTTPLCFIGHTHVPNIIREDGVADKFLRGARHIINVGSVGQPRDGDPSSAFGVYDSDDGSYELVRVPYAVKETASAIVNAGLPEYLAKRLYQGF